MTARKAPDKAPEPMPAEAYAARVNALHDAFNATARQSDAARILAVPGKSFRDNTRRILGVYVSRGEGAWDDATKARAWDTPYVQRAVLALVGPAPDLNASDNATPTQ